MAEPQPNTHTHTQPHKCSHNHNHGHGHSHGQHQHQDQQAHVHTVDSEKNSWNSFAEYYGDNLEKTSLASGITISRMAKVESAKSILEAGCSTGLLTLHWLNLLGPGVKYTSVDLSEEMIKFAQQRKEKMTQKFDNIDHSFVQGDAQNLSFIPDESIDVYISSLMFCHIPDPVKAFREALRVLKRGGRIGISMSTSGKNGFNELKVAAEGKAGVAKMQQPHSHALKNKEDLIKAAQEAGVQVDYVWEQDVPYELFDENEVVKMVESRGHGSKDMSKEDKEKVYEALKEGFREMKKNFVPLKFGATFLVGKKAE